MVNISGINTHSPFVNTHDPIATNLGQTDPLVDSAQLVPLVSLVQLVQLVPLVNWHNWSNRYNRLYRSIELFTNRFYHYVVRKYYS